MLAGWQQFSQNYFINISWQVFNNSITFFKFNILLHNEHFSYNHNASRYSAVKIKTSHFEDLDKIWFSHKTMAVKAKSTHTDTSWSRRYQKLYHSIQCRVIDVKYIWRQKIVHHKKFVLSENSSRINYCTLIRLTYLRGAKIRYCLF